MIHINFQDASDTDREPLNLEWIDTNGRGGYASSTLANCHTRKYHGLLVANLPSPPGRYVLLSKFEDSIFINGKELFLSQHLYPGFLFPAHEPMLAEFILESCPQFIYRMQGLQIRKSIMMMQGHDCVLVRYDLEDGPSSCVLRIKPFLAYRDYHGLAVENPFLQTTAVSRNNGFKIVPYESMPPLIFETNMTAQFSPSPVWYKQFEYPTEKERGFPYHEDLFLPGILDIQVHKGTSVIISAAASDIPDESPLAIKWSEETARRRGEVRQSKKITEAFETDEDRHHMAQLMTAGGQFLIHTPSGRPAIVAGYHWFSDWGRDTLISLPGLTFCSNRSEDGIAILAMLGKHEKDGLLPNYFSENEKKIAYNSMDASLWYFWAVQQLLIHTDDIRLIEERMWPVMKNIVKNLLAGTPRNCFVNGENGLLHAGSESTQLTWMDAVSNGKPVTPRWGYAVEINALWFNALCFTGELGNRFGDHELSLSDMIDVTSQSFSDAFWLEKEGYLADCFNEVNIDASIRPNQILAVSLPYSPLTPSQAAGVVNTVKEHLLTPVGLRTLSPSDTKYRGSYHGDSAERDAAYHQGTVWPWLFGHFGEAYLKVSGNAKTARVFLLNVIRSFLNNHFRDAGCGTISEIFDGSPPHRPNGCIAQAWSVAEIIRLYTILKRSGGKV
ncbi:MAG: glycogen debranching enzyme family protein [Deltaproteobacteria bacterium]|nr:glycogen debranching enzyme family protein [Deltaproteobacteria bacterium]